MLFGYKYLILNTFSIPNFLTSSEVNGLRVSNLITSFLLFGLNSKSLSVIYFGETPQY